MGVEACTGRMRLGREIGVDICDAMLTAAMARKSTIRSIDGLRLEGPIGRVGREVRMFCYLRLRRRRGGVCAVLERLETMYGMSFGLW